MLKLKLPISKLSSAIALSLFASAASADIPLYSTYKYLFNPDGTVIFGAPSGTDTLYAGDWAAGYFFVNPVNCSNGCDLTSANLLLDGGPANGITPTSFAGAQLEIYSNVGSAPNHAVVGTPLFTLNTPSPVTFDGNFGTRITFTANAQDQNAPALLQPNTGYWLRLTNVSQATEFGLFYNGVQANEYWSAHYGSGEGSPYIFEVRGNNSATPRLAPSNVPIPGAVWMMGSALLGLLAVGRRNKSN